MAGVGRGGVELVQHVLSQVDCVGEVLESQGVLGEARNREPRRDRAESDDEVVVRHLDFAALGLHGDDPGVLVEGGRPSEEDLGVRAHHTERDGDVACFDGAGRHLGQDRCVEHGALGADDRRAALAEAACDVRAGEPATEDQRSSVGGSSPRREVGLDLIPHGCRPTQFVANAGSRAWSKRAWTSVQLTTLQIASKNAACRFSYCR